MKRAQKIFYFIVVNCLINFSDGKVHRIAQSIDWSQLGIDIDGEAGGDESGNSVSLSGDGTVVAIGARNNDGNGGNSGHVRVYQFDDNASWMQLGEDIDGEAAGDYFGYSVSLSGDGTVVAIGARGNDGNGNWSGHVRVYQFVNNASWMQLGEDIDGEAASDESGFSVSLSDDGTVVAIGARYNDGNGNWSGHVRVYQFDSNASWMQLGEDMNSEAAGDWSGFSVSLSDDGTVVAIGAILNDNDNGNWSGHVRVYRFDDNDSWMQLGEDIDGEAATDFFGFSVSLSGDGTVVAIGAPVNDGNGDRSGHVKVYEYPISSPVPTPVPTLMPTPVPTPVPTLMPTPVPTLMPTPVPTPVPTLMPTPVPTPVPTLMPTLMPSSSPTSHITPWLVGPTMVTKIDPGIMSSGIAAGGESFFDDAMNITNAIGSKVVDDVVVELFDYQCMNGKESNIATSAVKLTHEHSDPDDFWFLVQIDQSNIGDDTEGFVFLDNTDGPSGNSTGSVKFCTRVSTSEGSVQIAFRETNFVLNFDLTENTFDLSDVDIEENVPDSFITDVDTDFSVVVYQCDNYAQVTPHTLEQDENLVICLEPSHSGDMASVVHISNFNIKMIAGSVANGDYVEYNPVWFSTDGWKSDGLTAVSEQSDPADIIMISTPVVAQFFIQGHTDIDINGNCFLEFDSTKGSRAPVFVGYEMQIAVDTAAVGEGCLVSLIRRIRGFF